MKLKKEKKPFLTPDKEYKFLLCFLKQGLDEEIAQDRDSEKEKMFYSGNIRE